MSETIKTKHPKGLYFLFFTEMWERFGYYLMLGIFVLYMIDVDTGGMGFLDKNADDIFGTFIALTYLTPFLGGFLADRVLGYVKSVYIGGVLMAAGYLALALPGLTSFYVALGLIIIGNGLFKPNISTLLGNIYSTEEYKSMKDSGYNIFYMGINIGAFVCNIIAAFMRNKFSWEAAFATAGIGLLLGLVVFSFGLKHFKEANIIKPKEKGDIGISKVLLYVFVPAIVAGTIGWLIPGNLLGSDSTDAFISACLPVIGFYLSLYFRANPIDKRPIAALLAVFAVGVMFWAVFKQNGTALTRWAKFYTERAVSPEMEKPLNDLYLVEEILYTDSEVTVYDSEFRVVRNDAGEIEKTIGKDVYFSNMSAEKLPTEGESVFLVNTELFQSVNPAWVIILTPLLVWFFIRLGKRNKEPTTAGKIALGLFISALSCLVMVAAAYYGNNGEFKVSPWWLIACYGVITLGELCLSPMGLSLVSKLSPPRLTALMMGGFFLSTSIGNKLSGVLASLWYGYEHKANFFLVNFILLMIATLFAVLILRWLNRIMKENNVH
ncbi:peptide MFS transporter [Moheibacter sp.]|uniref:peptide MFS transporter n=1 Tax=Moheibacter sp. TaxID=1965316 RepID=UPI003C77E816